MQPGAAPARPHFMRTDAAATTANDEHPDSNSVSVDPAHGPTRRSVLGVGLGGLALAATATGAQAAPAVMGLRAGPSAADWRALDKQVAGAVQLPGSNAYKTGKQLFDTAYDGSAPAAVVRVLSQADVQRTVSFAAAHGMRITGRSGGHSYVGASAANGTIVVDLRGYLGTKPNTDSGTVKVYAGTGLYAVHKTLAAVGRSIPTGTCPTVGVAGLTLGGGLGVDTRAYGLTCDRLVAATAVLADGSAVNVTPNSHADLFWAFQGGGGGANALATSFTFRTHPASSRGIFSLTFPASAGTRVLTRWASWLADQPGYRWSNGHLDAVGNGSVAVRFVGVTKAGDERAAAASLISAVGVSPTRSSYRTLGYLAAVEYLGGGTTSPRQAFCAGTDVLRTLGTGTANALLGAVSARSKAGRTGSALLDPMDGAAGKRSTAASAFPYRDHAFSVQWYVSTNSASARTSARSWIAAGHKALGSASSGGYVNYLESGQPASRYFGSNLARLRQVRDSYDPRRRFFCGLTI